MSVLGGFLLAVAMLLLLDGVACLLAPLLRSNLAWSRAMATNDQLAIRGRWLLGSGAALLFAVGALL